MLEDIVRLASDLIAIPSTSDRPDEQRRVLEFIRDYCVKAGLTVEKLEYSGQPSLYISINDNTPDILLNGHADVVPAKPNQFAPEIKDGKLYGRGAEDMKGQLAVLIYVMTVLAKQNPSAKVALLVNTDEEIGGHKGAKPYADSLKSKPKFVLVGEGTEFKIENAAKGVSWLKLVTSGVRAHGAYPWKGTNAISKLIDELSVIQQAYPRPADFVWETTCNFGVVSGGLAANQIPDRAEATLDIRRIPEETTEFILQKLHSSQVHSDTVIEVLANEPAHFAAPDEIFFPALSRVIRSVTGKDPELMKQCGASDARHFSAIGVPAICFGPEGSGLHSDEEYIETSQLDLYYRILTEFLLKSE